MHLVRFQKAVIIIAERADVAVQFQIDDDEFRLVQRNRVDREHDRIATIEAGHRRTTDDAVNGVVLQGTDHGRDVIVLEVFAQLLALGRCR